jgi:endonuclease/exonuclease/phosphatase family metal-dependent hydrolase
MNDVLVGSFAPFQLRFWPPGTIRVVNWNIDRGSRLPEVIDFLAAQDADLLLLQEADLNAKRTHRVNVAEEIARKLQMNYVFGMEFEELTQGSRISPAYHGQATLSRWRLMNPRVIRFQRQSDFWRPRWFLPRTAPFQERLGGRIALAVDVNVVGRMVSTYNLHLESRGDDDLRSSQLGEVLEAARQAAQIPSTIIAGDLNFDVSKGAAAKTLRAAGFRSVFGEARFITRPPHHPLGSPRSIDWALVSGSVEQADAQVYGSVKASDHYPLSFTLRFC